MKKIICWLKEIYNTLETGAYVGGCDFIEKEVHENCRVYISECKVCGKIDISWERM